MILHEALRFGQCSLALAVPEDWPMADVAALPAFAAALARPMRVATQYPVLARRFLKAQGMHSLQLVAAEGSLEAAPQRTGPD